MKVNKQKVYFRLANKSGFTSVSVVPHAKEAPCNYLKCFHNPHPPPKKKWFQNQVSAFKKIKLKLKKKNQHGWCPFQNWKKSSKCLNWK